MSRLLLLFAVAALSAPALSGCVGSGGATQSATGPSSVVEAGTSDQSTATITGTVTTDELEPIAGAQVGILELQLAAVTDAAGAFTITGISPGTYSVFAQALGFQSEGQKVTLTAGETRTMNLQLEPLPSDEPYHLTDIKRSTQRSIVFKLTPQCIATSDPLVATCNGVRFNCSPSGFCEVHYARQLDKEPDWKTMVGEVAWKPQSATTGKAFYYDVLAPNVTRGTGGAVDQTSKHRWLAMTYKAPIQIRIDNPASLLDHQIPEKDWCCDWAWRLFVGWCDLGSIIGNCETTPDYGISIDNPASVYYSIFFKEPAPEGFTAVPDA